MRKGLRCTAIALTGLGLTLAAAPAPQPAAQAAGGAVTAAAPKTAEQAYKNVQVLKGIPADQLIPSMQLISNSLGVECEYCHVRREFDKDDKLPKKTARRMIEMMSAINKDNFKGRTVVTCFSCHRGAKEPIGIPLIPETEEVVAAGGPGGAMAAPGAGAAMNPAAPKPAELVDKYVAALGGAEAIQKVTSRVFQGTLSGFAGHDFPVDVFAKAPDKRISVMHLPNGDSITAFDGQVGWMGFPGAPPHEMTGPEVEAVKLDSDFYLPIRLKQLYPQLRPARPEKVGDHEAYVVLGIKPGQPPVKLYFDEQSGLLVRLVRYAETPLGRFTIQAKQVQQNVPIDDTKFSKPPAPAASPGQKPSSP